MPWAFTRGRRATTVHASGRLVFNRSDPTIDAVVGGNGLAWLPEDLVREAVMTGRLAEVLGDVAATYPGYHVYDASRRASPALSLVVDALRPPAAE